MLLRKVLARLAVALALIGGCGHSDALPAGSTPAQTEDEAGLTPADPNANDPYAREFTLFVDPKFTRSQRDMIQKACDTWNEATSKKVAFLIHWAVDRPAPYQEFEGYPEEDHIYVWFIDKDNAEDVSPELKEEWAPYAGLMVPGNSSLIIYQSIVPNHFYRVALHEVGHMIGLEHTPVGVWSIMEPHARSYCMTQYEYDAACVYYNCVPMKQDPRCKDLVPREDVLQFILTSPIKP